MSIAKPPSNAEYKLIVTYLDRFRNTWGAEAVEQGKDQLIKQYLRKIRRTYLKSDPNAVSLWTDEEMGCK